MEALKNIAGAFLVAHWERIHVPMQGTWALSLIQGDPMYHGTIKPES